MTPRPEDTPAHLARWASHTDPCDLMMPPPARNCAPKRALTPPWVWAAIIGAIAATVGALVVLLLAAMAARAACNPLNCPPVEDIPVVPLPATALLLGGAVALLAWRARK